MNETEEKEIGSQIAIISEESIRDKIYVIRGQQVMLDFELAELYGYETKRFNEQIKNNIERFDSDFRFQLTKPEFDNLRSKKSTSSWGGTRYMPYAFTEQGIYMLMTVLKGSVAVEQSKALIRIFKQMKDYIAENRSLAGDKILQQLVLQTMKNTNDIHDMKAMLEEDTVRKSDLPEIIFSFGFSQAKCEYLMLNGETTEAALAYRGIYSQAKESIYIVDNYIGLKTLHLLNDIDSGVSVTIFSDNTGNRLRLSDYNMFMNEYPSVNINFVITAGIIHDRYIVLDYEKPSEQIYLCGASSKDAGRKVTTITKLSDNAMCHSLIDDLKKNPPLILS